MAKAKTTKNAATEKVAVFVPELTVYEKMGLYEKNDGTKT